ncbi:RNA exonuclease 1 homolog [Sceloporus undulatus]|uniref:RNA exonuclease 1 homolog n=1 Tax=Sceloporus undulatus TaxID=8520 RepID=UPI001C4DBE10|nr:RNA exonuclease 1 homolog [Sceloporus undulatus]
MLRSSGFFRGVECPFGQGCGRPYCHFRHPPGALHDAQVPAPAPAPLPRRGRAAACGYDPYNPELPKPAAQSSNGLLEEIPEPAAGILELELVNKAIEAAKDEYERDRKKYQELLETAKEYSSSETPLLTSETDGLATSNTFPSLEYTPGNYDACCSTDYNPTPLTGAAVSTSSKYTLDTFSPAKSKGSSLEYVPTIVSQPKKYSTSSGNRKYVIDNSKPSTDLEYDPLSNYSARLLSKAKEQKGTKRKRGANHGEAYSPSLKKFCDSASTPEPVARFSDSEEEREAACVSPPKSNCGAESKPPQRLGTNKKGTQQAGTSSREMKETAVQYDMEDIENPLAALVGKSPKEDRPKLSKAPSGEGGKEEEKGKGVPKDKLKKKTAEGYKTERKKDHGKDSHKEKVEVKTNHRNGERMKEKHSKRQVDGQNKEHGKLKSPEEIRGKEESLVKNKKTSKSSDIEKVEGGKKASKPKSADPKRKAESSKTEQKDGKGKRPSSEKPKGGLAISVAKCKGKQRALSHVDLFGDESGDEVQDAQPPPVVFRNVSSDSDGDGGCSPLPRGNGVMAAKRPKLSKAPPSSSSSSSSDDVDYSILERDLDFESDPMEECLRIFNESTDVKTEDKGRLGKQPSKEEGVEEKTTTLFPGQRKRISHVAKQDSTEAPSKPVIRPYRPPTAQEVCYQRIQQAQKQAMQLAQQQAQQQQQQQQQARIRQLPPTLQRRPSLGMHKGEKKRIAHVSNAVSPVAVKSAQGSLKKTLPPGITVPSNSADPVSLKARTLTGMASKTTSTNTPKRIAHAPTLQSATLKRPVIPTEFGAKVPTNIRQRYLNLFIDECLKSCSSQQEAFDKALSEEKVAYERSTSRNIYLNVAVNTLKKLRSLLPSPSQDAHKASNRKVVSHEAMLGGKLAAKTSFSFNRSTSLRVEDLTGPTLYRRLKEYLMTEDDLKLHGYPLPCSEKPGRAVVFTVEEKKTPESSCRICCRCGTEYMVTPSGNCVRKEECVHHWGKLRKQRVPGGWETHYNCCSGAVGSPGCQVAKQHVHDGRKENLEGFVKTFEKLPSRDSYPGIYALDCEMCYTKQGLELTRVTVIDADLKVVYDTFVKPDHKVVDYNTRFSGVTEADLENTSISIRDVQAVLLSMFSTDTILIGHSLESDLFALKLIHCTVVDTAIVFPHRLGLPYKRALRTLMADYLKRIIQDSVEGHDSSEDARACMELMIWKIKEDAKVKR